MCAAVPIVGAILNSSPFPAENRQKLRADELRREYHEEQRNEFENFVEEQNDGKSPSASIFRTSGTLWEDHMICLHFFSLNFNGRREVREALHSIHIHESLEKKGESHKNAYRTWEGMEEDGTPSGGLSNTYTNGLALVKLGWEDFKLTFKCLGVTSV